jgi:hypothetical protein
MGIYEDGVLDTNIQETLLFIAEAYQFSEQYVKSNKSLIKMIEYFDSEIIPNEFKHKTLKLISTNH